MKSPINSESVNQFAYVNDAICKMPIKGIVLNFFGMGVTELTEEEYGFAKKLADKGFLFITPYLNPWAFLNEQARIYTDEVISVLMAKYNFPTDIPFVACGSSMGGYSALMFAEYSKYNVVACVVDCPACDLADSFTEIDWTARIAYNVFFYSDADCLEDAARNASPVNLIDTMPRINYYIFHCENDSIVNIDSNSTKFAEKMKAAGHNVTYHIVPEREHCDLPEDMKALYQEYIIQELVKESVQ